MSFVRFVLSTTHPESGVEAGVFRLAYEPRDDPHVPEADREALAHVLEWFDRNLPRPDRFNRSTSKGFYRRRTHGIAWLRDTATESISRMHQVKDILARHGHQVTMIHATRGYVVYEDDLQVTAEPFADTDTVSRPHYPRSPPLRGWLRAIGG
jgi:hypothetical protein